MSQITSLVLSPEDFRDVFFSSSNCIWTPLPVFPRILSGFRLPAFYGPTHFSHYLCTHCLRHNVVMTIILYHTPANISMIETKWDALLICCYDFKRILQFDVQKFETLSSDWCRDLKLIEHYLKTVVNRFGKCVLRVDFSYAITAIQTFET